jgi:hypothetical protein
MADKIDKIIEIDSLNVRPHTRHRAIVNKVRKPCGDRVLDSSIAMTLCGRAIGWFTKTIGTSLTFEDGTVYAVQCRGCYPEEPVVIDRNTMSSDEYDRYARGEMKRRFDISERLRGDATD